MLSIKEIYTLSKITKVTDEEVRDEKGDRHHHQTRIPQGMKTMVKIPNTQTISKSKKDQNL